MANNARQLGWTLIGCGDAGQNDLTGKWFFEFFDGSASAVLHDHWQATTLTCQDRETGKHVKETICPEPAARFAPLVAAIRDGSDSPVGSSDGIRVALLMERILESISTGLPQRWVAPVSA